MLVQGFPEIKMPKEAIEKWLFDEEMDFESQITQITWESFPKSLKIRY